MPRGRHEFYKMCGSGNDFVFFDARRGDSLELEDGESIRTICARGTGVGADGVVFLVASDRAPVGIRYYNSDGSRASLCGNATLCATRLAVELRAAPGEGFLLETDVGLLSVRMTVDGPEIDFAPVQDLAVRAAMEPDPGERRIGYALAGVPHLVVEVDDIETVPLETRGRALRFHPSLTAGANVNFVVAAPDGGWYMRTYERGVEGETLACGTGAVASAMMLRAWGAAGDSTRIITRSRKPLTVRANPDEQAGPSLQGEGRIVYVGQLRELR